MTAAAIDVGTNSVRMLVQNEQQVLARELEITRLGEGVDANHILRDEPIGRTIAVVKRFVERARALGAGQLVVAATAAVRDSKNKSAFVRAVFEQTGLSTQVLSGAEEATLSFAGACSSFDPSVLKVVIDIGGGSTELAAGRGAVSNSVSTQAGSVRLTERHIRNDPPSDEELSNVRADVAHQLRAGALMIAGQLEEPEPPIVIGVAGTFTTLCGLILGLDRYDRDRIHRSVITLGQVERMRAVLARMTTSERARSAVITPGRADVIVSGSVIVEESLKAFGASEVTISETDILDGLIASI